MISPNPYLHGCLRGVENFTLGFGVMDEFCYWNKLLLSYANRSDEPQTHEKSQLEGFDFSLSLISTA